MSVARDWQSASLESVAKIINGGTPASGIPGHWDGDVWWLTPKDMGKMRGREISQTPRTITQTGLRSSSARLVPENSIILSTRAPIGHLAINTKPMAFNQGCRGIVPGDRLNHQFLYYFLLSSRQKLDGLGTGATFKELSAGALRSFEVPLPPLDEQKRIVAVLDQAFAALDCARANSEKNLRETKTAFDAHIHSMFSGHGKTWNKKTLGELADFRNGINFTKASKGMQVRVLGVKDFQNHFHAPDEGLAHVTINGELDPSDFLRRGDIVFVRSNGNPELIGRSLVIEATSEKTAHSGFTIRARLRDDEVLPSFLGHFLKTSSVRKQMSDGGTGTNIKSLNQGTLSRVLVPYPARTEQATVVERIEDMRGKAQTLLSLYTHKIAEIADLRQSLLQAAFSGQLT